MKNVTTALLAGLILSSMPAEAMGFKLSERGWKFWATATALVASVGVLAYKVLAIRSTRALVQSPYASHHIPGVMAVEILNHPDAAIQAYDRQAAQQDNRLAGQVCNLINGTPVYTTVEERSTTAHNTRSRGINTPAPSSTVNFFGEHTGFGFATPLHQQIKRGTRIEQFDVENARMTREYINAQDECGNNALHMAAQYGNIASMPTLAQYIDINTQNDQGNTPLHEAILTAYDTPMSYPYFHELLTDLRAQNRLNTADIRTQDATIKALLRMPNINLDIPNHSGFTPREYLQAYNTLANQTDIQAGELSVPATERTSILALKRIIAQRITPPVTPAERITLVRNGMASEAPNNQLVGLTKEFQMTINNASRFTPPLRGAHYDAR